MFSFKHTTLMEYKGSRPLNFLSLLIAIPQMS